MQKALAQTVAWHLESEVPAEDTILHNSLENLVVAIPFFCYRIKNAV